MERAYERMKVLFFVMVGFPQASGDTHSLQYLYTELRTDVSRPYLSAESQFTAVGTVDGEQIVYYEPMIRRLIPKTEWIKRIDAGDPDYWRNQTQEVESNQKGMEQLLVAIMKDFNHTKGVHTLQWTYGCELDDDGTTRGFDQYGYDGEDFIRLDLKTGTWIAPTPQAQITKHEWEAEAKRSKNYLEKECIEQLKTLVSYGRETLERKVRPEVSVFQNHSSSPEVVCHATGFFPKAVNITWQKDGEDVYEDVELRETLPNQDGSFQKRSILKVPAEELQKHTYTCVIQHSSLEKDVVLSVSERRILNKHPGSVSSVFLMLTAVFGTAIFLSVLFAKLKKKPNRGAEAEDNEFSEKILERGDDEMEYTYVIYSSVSQ